MPEQSAPFDENAPAVQFTVDFGNGEAAVTAKVTLLRQHAAATAAGPAVGLDACLEIATIREGRSVRYFLSRLLGETRWIIDAMYVGPKPIFAHGFGHRDDDLRTLPVPLTGYLDHLAQQRTMAGPSGDPEFVVGEVRHRVSIESGRPNPATERTELHATCACGWSETHPFGRLPEFHTTEGYARARLTIRASAHVAA